MWGPQNSVSSSIKIIHFRTKDETFKFNNILFANIFCFQFGLDSTD